MTREVQYIRLARNGLEGRLSLAYSSGWGMVGTQHSTSCVRQRTSRSSRCWLQASLDQPGAPPN